MAARARARHVPMHRQSPLTILLLADDDPRDHAGTTLDHIAAFRRYSRHNVLVFNPRSARAARLLRLSAYDVVAIHHSLIITMDSYVPSWLREQIARHGGLKVCFRQDEFRWVDATNMALRDLGVDVLFSVSGEAAAGQLYAPNLSRLEIVQVLTGYVPEMAGTRQRVPLSDRPIDVGYRGRRLPYWLGRFSQEKAEIARQFLVRAQETTLVCDIAWDESERLYGDEWTRFLESCRAMLGTEGGASIADFDGSVERAVVEYLSDRPEASFEEVEREVLEPYEGNVVVTAISPRIFEAAAAWTPLVLFPGDYSGVIEPGRHYLPLEKDFSNFDGVVDALGDEALLDAMVERAHADLVASGKYSHRALVDLFDRVVEERAGAGRGTAAAATAEAQHERALLEQRLRHGARIPQARARALAGVVLAKLARLAAASYLVVEDPASRSLWLNYVRHPSLIRSARPRALFRDLLRLSLARRVARRGRPLAVVTQGLETIVWEYEEDEDAVFCALPGGWTMRIPVHRPGERRYRFAALEAHARVAPDRVCRSLERVLDAPAQGRVS